MDILATTAGIWIAVAIVAAVIEVASLGLITMWFVVGALVAFVCALLGVGFIAQIVIFLVVSILCLVLLRPVILKYRQKGQAAEPSVIGEQGIVCEAIDNERLVGRVELSNHMTWAARSATEQPIEEGTPVKVVSQQSVKLIVEPLSGKEN